jgi:DNA (cytosine-5)-methyltransferase 1
VRIGSLFAGIGGLELGLERAGVGHVEWQVEIDPWCRAVLARHWHNASRSVHDVTEASAANLSEVDVICGGFPCQDVSSAGLGAGLDGDRSGLWREYLRILGELRPRAVVVENVASGKGRWLREVRGGLCELGYRTRALGIGASDVGAPHLRRRIFVLALADSDGGELRDGAERLPGGRPGDLRGEGSAEPVDAGHARDVADADQAGRERVGRGSALDGERAACGDDLNGCGGEAGPEVERRAGPQPAMGRGADGVPAVLVRRAEVGGIWDARPIRWPAGRGAEQHGWEPPRAVRYAVGTSRPDQLAAIGNAVMPACAEVAGRVLLDWIGGR